MNTKLCELNHCQKSQLLYAADSRIVNTPNLKKDTEISKHPPGTGILGVHWGWPQSANYEWKGVQRAREKMNGLCDWLPTINKKSLMNKKCFENSGY